MTITVRDVTTSHLSSEKVSAGAKLWTVPFVDSGYFPDLLLRPGNSVLMGNGVSLQILTKGATRDFATPIASISGNSMEGSFKLSLGGHVTSSIPFNTSLKV